MVDLDKNMIEEALKWRAAMTDHPVSDANRHAFEAWLQADLRHREAYEHAERFWMGLATLERGQLDDVFFSPSWRERVQSNLFGLLQQLVAVHIGPRVALGGAAAALVLAIVFMPFWNGTTPPMAVTFSSDIGEIRQVTLDDGSSITLGARSEISVLFDEDLRAVELIVGDAFFDVESDPSRPFLVTAGDMRAKVLGTSFDVQLGPGVSRVAVAEGLVNVTFPMMPEVEGPIEAREAASGQTRVLSSRRLEAGQQVAATMNQGLGSVSAVKPDSIGAWRRSRLVYYDAPLSELVADANRYFDRQISIADDALGELKISATFNSSDIHGMLSTLTEIFPVRVEDEPNQPLIIRSDG